jgi:phosphatidate cytidylyltransferase
MKRVLTALVLMPLVSALVLHAPYFLLAGVTGVVASLCFLEYLPLARAHGMAVSAPLGLAAGWVTLLVPSPHVAVLTVMLAAAMAASLSRGELREVLPANAGLGFGVVYVFGAWRCGLELGRLNAHYLLFALAVNWVGDAAAYAVGSKLGRRRLAERVSPKKTWEGAAGALLASVAFGAVYLPGFVAGVSVGEAAGLAALANVAGQFGDLAESAMKRGAGVKDSGGMLPGHGGWLDRVDSALFTLPALYVWLAR